MKTRLISILIIAALLLSVSACTKTDAPLTAADYLSLGEKYLLDLDYEQAVVQFLKAIEIEPMNPRGYTGAAQAYIAMGEMENASEILEDGLSEAGENADIRNMLDELYGAEEERRQAELEAEEARRQEDERAKSEQTIRRELDTLLTEYESGGLEAVLQILESGELWQLLQKSQTTEYIILNDAGDYGIGVYKQYLYIGGYDADGKRSGQALWLYLERSGQYFEGAWANDLPNGDGTIYMGGEEQWVISGTLADGLWTGSVTEVIDNGNLTFIVEFVNGKVVVTKERDEEGRSATSYGEDGDPNWFWRDEEINGTHGVFPFAQYMY